MTCLQSTMKKLFAIILIITATLLQARGDNLRLSRFDMEGGLTNNKINTLTRSRDGFLWLGSIAGLVRHDGYNYRIYYINGTPLVPQGENDVDAVIEDASGRLWLKSHDTWHTYNPLTDRIEHNADSILAKRGVTGSVTRIDKDYNSGMWIYTDADSVFHLPANAPKAFPINFGDFPTLENKVITSFADSGRGMTAITDRGELYEISPVTHRVERYDNHIPRITGRDEKMVHTIFYDREGYCWIYTTERLWLFDSNLRVWKEHLLPGEGRNMIVKSIMQDSNGRMWLARDHHGLERILKRGDRFEFVHGADSEMLPDNSTITALYEDRNGTIWVGTFKYGLFLANESTHKFSLARMPDTNCLFTRPDGKVWVGTDSDGLLLWNPADDTYIPLPDPSEGSEPSSVTALYEDPQSTLYIGSFSRGLRTRRDGHFRRLDTKSPIDDTYTWAITPSKDGSLWIATLTAGFFNFDPRSGSVTPYTTANFPLTSDCVMSIVEAPDGTVYAATAYGVVVLSADRKNIRPLEGLPLVTVNDLLVDHRGLLWIASQQGVNIYDPRHNKLVGAEYAASPGARYATGIEEDRSGTIWVAEGGKLVNFEVNYDENTGDIQTTPRIYDSRDGLQNVDFNHRSFALLPSGQLLVGGLHGVNRFDPDEISFNNVAPKVMFSSISVNGNEIAVGEKVNGRTILPTSLNSSPVVSLGPDTNDFTVAFATDNFVLPGKTVFHYRLEGLDDEWKTTPPGSNYATYTNLSPGNYRLLVRAVNNDGIIGDETAIDISVDPPFYLTVWAFIFYALLFVAAIAAIIIAIRRHERRRFTEKQHKEALKKEEELNNMKFKFFTSVSHDLRTPLTLIISPLDTMIKETEDESKRARLGIMRRNAGHLLDMVNQLLDFRKIEMDGLKLHPTHGDLAVLIANICNSFKMLYTSKNVTLDFRSDTPTLPMTFDDDKMYKVMMNLLSNAYKFTPDGGRIEVALTCSEDRKNVTVTVRDTGSGVCDADKQRIFDRFYQSESTGTETSGYGIGLALVKEYIELHEGTIEVKDNTPSGAVFEFTIPVVDDTTPTVDDMVRPKNATPGALYAPLPAPEPKKPAQEPTPQPGTADGEKPLALVIDDNIDMLRFLKDGLTSEFRVFTATDGEAALTLLATIKPAIIVTDIMMPSMDGAELCRRVKGNPDLADIPLIALSAKSDEQAKVEMLTIGADDYITKPFNIELLILRMKRVVSLAASGAGRRLITPEPGNIDITPLDEKLVEKAIKYVVNNMKRTDLSVEELSSYLGMSRVHLYKKLKAVTGKTPIEFIRLIRLKRATQLLRESQLNVSEVAYQVGFNSPKYFARYFKEEYNILPSEYKDLKEQTTFHPL